MTSATSAAGSPASASSGSLARTLIDELARACADLPRPELRKATDRVADALAVLRTIGSADDQVEATIRALAEVQDRLRTAAADLSGATGEIEHYALHAVGMPLPGYPDSTVARSAPDGAAAARRADGPRG